MPFFVINMRKSAGKYIYYNFSQITLIFAYIYYYKNEAGGNKIRGWEISNLFNKVNNNLFYLFKVNIGNLLVAGFGIVP